VIEQVNRLEAKEQRRVAVLLEDYSGSKRCFKTVGRAGANDTAESPHRVAALFIVVWESIQPALNRGRCTQPVNQALLGRGEFENWRD
jgi:hypothetical protein